MSDDNLYANLALQRIARALRQERRVQSAYKRLRTHEERHPAKTGPQPSSWVKRQMALEDEIYFLIVATNHAISARQMMTDRGHADLPEIRASLGLQAWRNVLEHWDDPGRGLQLRSLRNWESFNPREVEPGLSMGGRGYKLTTMSGVSLKQLRHDLTRLNKAIAKIGDAAWSREWLTPHEAATVTGLPVDDLPPSAALDFSDMGKGMRYPRQWAELHRNRR